MIRRALITIVFMAIGLGMAAQAQHDFGLGVMAGEPTGLSFKAWLSSRTAFDGGAAWSFSDDEALSLHGDYIIHSFGLIEDQPRAMAFYYGVGARIKFGDEDTFFGIRIPLGLVYIFAGRQLDLFVEAVPVVDLAPDTEFRMNGAIGIRYFF